MKKIKDKFSVQSENYKKYRPTYPQELYDFILSFVKHKNKSWDCGTGNGQVASVLSDHFNKVYASDISQNQLNHAIKKENIEYSLQRVEQTSYEDNQFDLVTVAQAIHWFDFKAFFQEVRRVLNDDGVLAFWGYGLLRIDTEIDQLMDDFHWNTIAPYWNEERKYIDQSYQNIPLDMEEIEVSQSFSIQLNWTLEDMEGYLNSWSAVQNYIEKNSENPISEFMEQLNKHWMKDELKAVSFPVFLRMGVVSL